MSRKFLNIHVLYSFAGANPNRDDTGSPKTLRYGGVERTRMSPQSMTRAKRVAYESDPAGERSYRSTQMPAEVARRAETLLDAAGQAPGAAEHTKILTLAALELNKLVMKAEKATKKAEALAADAATPTPSPEAPDVDEAAEAGDTLVWLAEAEVQAAAARIAETMATGEAALVAEDFLRRGRTTSLSIAAFGRMFAQRPDLQNEAAIQRSDAFTTHAAVTDLDYFTAVDDLRTSDRGAAHIGLRQDTGGVYYWHANIDRDQLLTVWDHANVGDPHARLRALAEHLLTRLPQGGQSHSAHHGLPMFALIGEADAPVSLQTAYERPIAAGGGGYLPQSIEALVDEHNRALSYAPAIFGTTLITGLWAAEVTQPNTRTVDQAHASDAIARWALDGQLPA